jgi:hypothetical protein
MNLKSGSAAAYEKPGKQPVGHPLDATKLPMNGAIDLKQRQVGEAAGVDACIDLSSNCFGKGAHYSGEAAPSSSAE